MCLSRSLDFLLAKRGKVSSARINEKQPSHYLEFKKLGLSNGVLIVIYIYILYNNKIKFHNQFIDLRCGVDYATQLFVLYVCTRRNTHGQLVSEETGEWRGQRQI